MPSFESESEHNPRRRPYYSTKYHAIYRREFGLATVAAASDATVAAHEFGLDQEWTY